MMIFGGESTKTFTFDTREVGSINKSAVIKTARSQMSCRALFGNQADWIARTFGNFVYCIDAKEFNLHVFTLKEKAWNSQPLTELGIPKQ